MIKKNDFEIPSELKDELRTALIKVYEYRAAQVGKTFRGFSVTYSNECYDKDVKKTLE